MPIRSGLALLLAGVATPAPAQDPAAIERRLSALEAELASLRAELAAARAASAPATVSSGASASTLVPSGPAAGREGSTTAGAEQLAALERRLETVESREGFRVGGTTFRVGGYVKLWAAYSLYRDGTVPSGALIRDFWLPQQVPVGGERSTHFGAHLKQTRLWMSGTTTAGGSPLTGYVEVDFQTAPGTQGTARTTNGYNLAVRRATISWKGLTAGQDWSTFQNVAALPETTDFIGPTEGTVFVRQPLVRWTLPLGSRTSLALAVENPITATITSDSLQQKETDEAVVPDFVARVTRKEGAAELSLAALAHDVTVNDGITKDSAFGWGLSLGGRVPFGPGNRHDLRFMLTGGEGIGHYIGLNFAPDGVFSGGRVHPVGVVAGFGALRFALSSRVRTTIMGGVQKVDFPDVAIPAGASTSAWSIAGNVFATPLDRLDVGVEVRHGSRQVASGASGALDRFEFMTRFNF